MGAPWRVVCPGRLFGLMRNGEYDTPRAIFNINFLHADIRDGVSTMFQRLGDERTDFQDETPLL